MKTLASILLGKAVFKLSRFLGKGGGSAAPGLYALKINPNLVEKLSSEIPTNIIVTGTNGKTTTSRMIAHFAKANNVKIIRNQTGSNLERGIASALVSNYSLKSKRYTPDLGIWELDEAAFNSVALKINPKIIVFLNIFRDQLDRYGEVDSLVKKWGETIKKLGSDTTILVNADDANILKLTEYFKGKIIYFGVKDHKINGEISSKKKGKKLNFEAKNIKSNGLSGSVFSLIFNHESLTVNLPLPGIYHIYDFIAAFTIGVLLGLDSKKMNSSLKNFLPAFGRVEKLDLPRLASGKAGFGYIFLIKNPVGATQVFETMYTQLKSNDRLLLALNDNLADGTDVSWIWDANFELLQVTTDKLQVTCSGNRTYDLANRLKYAGFNPKQITIEPDLEKAFRQAKRGLKGRLFILPTYTAMLSLQSILVKSGIKKPYWEESH